MPQSGPALPTNKTAAAPSFSSSSSSSVHIPDPIVYHAVHVGQSVRSCIFLRWSDAERHVVDFEGAEYETFDDVDEAVVFALLGSTTEAAEGGEASDDAAAPDGDHLDASDEFLKGVEEEEDGGEVGLDVDAGLLVDDSNDENGRGDEGEGLDAALKRGAATTTGTTSNEAMEGEESETALRRGSTTAITAEEATQNAAESKKRKRDPKLGTNEVDDGEVDTKRRREGEEGGEEEQTVAASGNKRPEPEGDADPKGGVRAGRVGRPRKGQTEPSEEWTEMYDRLRAIHKATGSIYIDPRGEDNSKIRKWYADQRHSIRKDLKKWKRKEVAVPPILSRKMQLLEEVGYTRPEVADRIGQRPLPAAKPSQTWKETYEELKKYKEETGSVDIEPNDQEHAALRVWLKRQQAYIRGEMRKLKRGEDGNNEEAGTKELSPLTQEKARLLEKLDVDVRCGPPGVCDPSRFDEMLGRFQQYKADHDGRDLPNHSNDKEVVDLCKWTRRQREEYCKLRDGKHSALSARNLQKLNEAGFNFEHRLKRYVPWKERMQQLRQFKEEHGHLYVPKRHPMLGEFVQQKRKEYNKFMAGKKTSKIIEKQVNDLIELEFVFDTGRKWSPPAGPIRTWDERFAELVEFKALHGHCVVPKPVPGLGQWVRRQRADYKYLKEGKPSSMTPERVYQLTDIGFVWDATGKQREDNEIKVDTS